MFISKKVLAGIIFVCILLAGITLYGFVFRSSPVDPSKDEKNKEVTEELSNENVSSTEVATPTFSSSPVVTEDVAATPKPDIGTKPSVKNFATAISFNPDVPFEFSIPEGYDFSPDIGATIVNLKSATGSGKPPFAVFVWPDETAKNTEEYVQNKEKLSGYARTGQTRMIGGYKAYILKNPKNSNETIYAFLTKYNFSLPLVGDSSEQPDTAISSQLSGMKYGIGIISSLSQIPGGKEAEELMLSTFKFVD